MSSLRIISFGFLVVWLFAPDAAHAEISAELSADAASLFIYEPFTLHLTVESDSAPDVPEIPRVADVAVTTIRRLPAEPTRRRHSFEIELISEREGMITIPPFLVRSKDGATMTAALRLRIRKPRAAAEMSLKINVEPTDLHVGQPATVTVEWTSRVSFKRCKQLQFEIPLLADRRCQVFPLEPAAVDEEVGLPVNNVRMVAEMTDLSDEGESLVFRYRLIPDEPCVLRSAPARLLCALTEEDRSAGELPSYFYNHFFEKAGEGEAFEEIYLAASLPEITVGGLPEAERTARFCGVVGPCSLRASVAPTEMTVGQLTLLTVYLENLSFARQITELPTTVFDGLRPDFQLSREPIRQNATDSMRSFTYSLRPLHTGITRIPAVVIQTFDNQTGKYRTVRSDPIPITVTTGPENESRSFTPRIDSRSPIPLDGIRANRSNERTMIFFQHVLHFLGQFWWLFVPLPPLVYLALRPLARRYERCRRDPAYARAVAAWRRFQRAVTRDEESAWRVYLADRLALHADALTADTVADALLTRDVDAELIAETRRRFDDKDATDYGKRPPSAGPDTRSLVKRLQKATVPLLLICGCAMPLRVQAAEDGNALFDRAMQMRADQPDEAQLLFVDAALQFESTEQFFNAANSWFFAGENGRALANYRAAERRAPFDWQLRGSIEFLRSQRTDAFPAPAGPTGIVASRWERYCTWVPVLRVGSFVLAWLLAWGFVLTAELTGRRFRRSVWVALSIAVLMPLVSFGQTSLRDAEGVIVEDSVARLGPGYAYDPAFKESLHKATEFLWLETRREWVHCRFPDNSEGWLRETDCMRVK